MAAQTTGKHPGINLKCRHAWLVGRERRSEARQGRQRRENNGPASSDGIDQWCPSCMSTQVLEKTVKISHPAQGQRSKDGPSAAQWLLEQDSHQHRYGFAMHEQKRPVRSSQRVDLVFRSHV